VATWPDLTEYHEALQHPAKSFADAGLKQAKIELDRFGMPKPATGGNAVVYKASERAETWAVRCFLRPISDHAERYAAISRHLEKARLSYGARFLFLKDGILVRGNWFPVVKMAWVDGDLFHRYIEDHLKQPAVLAGLREKWRTLVRELEAARLAHGDLQHGNILVRKDSLVLVDYDGMWVPALNGRSATEIGHRSYQHPKRSESDFVPYLDRFPALVIYLSLAALEHNPKLWDDYHTGDNLLFVRDDFRQAGKSPLWQELAAIRSDEIAHLTGTLAACLEKSPSDVPDLESILKHSTRLKPKALPAGPLAGKAAPPSGLPAWLASGAASALPISDVARQWKIVWSRPGQRVETRWKAGTPAPAAVKPTHTRRSSGGGTKVAIIVIGLAIAAIVASQGATTPAGIIAGAAIVIALLSSGAPRSAAASDDDEGDSSAGRETFRVSTPGMKSKVFAIQASADGNEVAVVTHNGDGPKRAQGGGGRRQRSGRLEPRAVAQDRMPGGFLGESGVGRALSGRVAGGPGIHPVFDRRRRRLAEKRRHQAQGARRSRHGHRLLRRRSPHLWQHGRLSASLPTVERREGRGRIHSHRADLRRGSCSQGPLLRFRRRTRRRHRMESEPRPRVLGAAVASRDRLHLFRRPGRAGGSGGLQ